MQQRSGAYRPLLPATGTGQGPVAGQGPDDRPSRSSKRARHHGTSRIACDACRARKIACDALRPTCTTCKLRDLECVYTPRLTASEEERQAMDAMKLEIDDLRQRLDESEEVISMLQSTSETRAVELLKGLRATPDIPTFLMQVGSKRLTGVRERRVPSFVTSTTLSKPSLQPPSQFSLEFELMVRHALAYPTLHPVEATRIDLQQLFSPSRSSNQGSQEEQNSHFSSASSEPDGRKTPRLLTYDSGFRPSARPIQPGLCDQRLAQLQIKKWTDVPITDSLAAAAISLYLETDHPVLALFDDDLFLDDLIACKRDFCSPLLVCALLCSCCQAYSYFDPSAGELSPKFWDKAEQLWTQEEEAPLLTTVAATQFMSIAALCHGKDAQGLFYMKKGVAMGKRMGLFGVSRDGSAQQWLDDHVNWIRAASQTAWGVFNWVTFRCLHYRTGQIETPPHLPIPGNVHDKGEADKETHNLSLPRHIGKSFTAMCHFWSIIHDVIWSYYDSEDFVAPASRAHFEFAENAYQQLLNWADNLSLDLARSNESAHHVVLAHIYLHASISDIFRPFLQGPMRYHNMESFASKSSTPEAAYLASSHQLKRLLLVYRARFSSADYCFLWHTALLYVANGVLRKQTLGLDPEWELWFRLCLAGYGDLFRCFKMVKVIYRGLLSMAMRNGVMTAADAQEAIEQLDIPPADNTEIEELGSMIVDLDLAMTDPLAAQAGILAEQFKDLALFDEFTTSTEAADGTA